MTKLGRPSLYTDELADTICERIANGEPLARISREEGMPGVTTVWDWEKARPDFSERLARAREAGADMIALQALEIADTPVMGETRKQELMGVMKREEGKDAVVLPDAELVTTEVKQEDMLGHRKLQVETRLKLLACWDPRRYGAKVAVDNKHSGAVGFAVNINDQPKPKP